MAGRSNGLADSAIGTTAASTATLHMIERIRTSGVLVLVCRPARVARRLCFRRPEPPRPDLVRIGHAAASLTVAR
ncbi:hypothetical protein GCM10027167_15880 [Nocardia heshunensis]